ncbi:hypothetical protein MTO96_015135 [Rhipicephalus appendiculatus]
MRVCLGVCVGGWFTVSSAEISPFACLSVLLLLSVGLPEVLPLHNEQHFVPINGLDEQFGSTAAVAGPRPQPTRVRARNGKKGSPYSYKLLTESYVITSTLRACYEQETYLGDKLNNHDKSTTPCLPKQMVPFTGSSQWSIPDGISGDERLILEKIVLSPLQAQCLEKNSRQQRASQTWCQERKHRLTSSNFGTVLMRNHWSSKGLGHLTSAKDLSRVPAVRYGIANEARALQRYQDVLKHTGRDVELQSVGLFVDPEQPWLGASPDAIVHDALEDPPWGCVEVKCPYSMKDADQEKLLACGDICVSFDSLNHPALKPTYPYFAQVMGQMAITKLQWADFVMYGENYICVQRVRFDEKVWHEMKQKLDSFYFDTLLPYFVRNVGLS